MNEVEELIAVAYEAADNIESLAEIFDEDDPEHIRLIELAKMLARAADQVAAPAPALSLERETE